MDDHAKEIVREMTRASDEERISFPEVVRALVGVGVERYHADLVQGTRTYFMPDGNFEVTHGYASGAAATAFQTDGVEAAVRAIQRGEITYRAFCDRIATSGCVGYFVSLVGRRATYYGRTNDTYVEWFPGAKP
jgi:uncharacterized protein YbcV (DUF1398 family)